MIGGSLGICVGASTVSFVRMAVDGSLVEEKCCSVAHNADPKAVIRTYLAEHPSDGLSVVVTGRRLRHLVEARTVSEPEAVEKAFRSLGLAGQYHALASLGGETFLVYCMDDNGNIVQVLSGNKCASGTGEFFLQQIRRMNLSVEEAAAMAEGQTPYGVSGRCSVFCKSDCTHALNKGVSKPTVVAGLCRMIAAKIIELLAKQPSTHVAVIGGVSMNGSVLRFIREQYPALTVVPHATCFEAYGAALIGLERHAAFDAERMFKHGAHRFSFHPPIECGRSRVIFKEIERAQPEPFDECLLGLDVGSTTTKAVLLRRRDTALLASAYLRTNGSPVQASLDCYAAIRSQVTTPIRITGLGTTGSGRHIAGLHALTKGVINEIIAHAVAAAYFDPDVDTIFEIGGQDAKYTYLTNGVASDYAMNEACSAGTGSFLEEAARESLSIDYRDIAEIALRAERPPNFNDQCAAFISSDIKTAAQEGISQDDVVAGLVYSICLNYVNRVKGNRSVGDRIFMQGGVCYNRAVPMAMATLINKEIVVPPEPGLMGAFGVALEVRRRLDLGLMEPQTFDLEELMQRTFSYGKSFVCAGGEEKCDRKCPISIIEVEEKKYPFGGACNRFYDQRLKEKKRSSGKDYVHLREEMVFRTFADGTPERPNGKTVGILKSFSTNVLYPLFHGFFTRLGFRVVLANQVDPRGLEKMNSSFCFPVELSHGMFENLLRQNVDLIFLPHIQEMEAAADQSYHRLCVFAQAEPYYLQNAFRDKALPPVLSPVINFARGIDEVEKTFTSMAKELGVSAGDAREAFRRGYARYAEMRAAFKELGREALEEVASDRHRFGIILFGRPYNTFASEANLGIPHKIATKDLVVIPHDLLPSDHLPSYENMYWANGQQIIRGTRFVKQHPKLFGVFVTNFSCGPDSFIVSYFRRLMGSKPSLTLELDSHSADVGINTRIEAALDIMSNYMELSRRGMIREAKPASHALQVFETADGISVQGQDGQVSDLRSGDTEVIMPSVGHFGASALAAGLRSAGIPTIAMPIPTATTLKEGRGHSTCKECLPYILTTGQMVEHLAKKQANGDNRRSLFFMPGGCGPCRQGQYNVKMKDVIDEKGYRNAGVLALREESSYGGLGGDFFRKSWVGLLASDFVADIENALKVLADRPAEALEVVNAAWKTVECQIEKGTIDSIYEALEQMTEEVLKIPLRTRPEDAKTVSLIGEIYVRREEFSAHELMEMLISNGFVVRTTPVAEFVYYTNYLGAINGAHRNTWKERLGLRLKNAYQWRTERRMRKILSRTGMVGEEMLDIRKTIRHATHLLSDDLIGEAVLTVGTAMREILESASGIVSIGPFACMPGRLAEAILVKEMTIEGKRRSNGSRAHTYPHGVTTLPYLHVETDGNTFPQITRSKIEIFMLQADKLHRQMMEHRRRTNGRAHVEARAIAALAP